MRVHSTGWRNGKEQVNKRPVTTGYSFFLSHITLYPFIRRNFIYISHTLLISHSPLSIYLSSRLLSSPVLALGLSCAGLPIGVTEKPSFTLKPPSMLPSFSPSLSLPGSHSASFHHTIPSRHTPSSAPSVTIAMPLHSLCVPTLPVLPFPL